MKTLGQERADWTGVASPGPVGDAVEVSFSQRLKRFIENEDSEPIQLFSDDMRAHSLSGDWYGEHVGKWLVAAGHALRRTESDDLTNTVERIVSFLIDRQGEDGYLGTYSAEYAGRLTNEAASSVRTWDLWVHAWMILGLLQVADALQLPRAFEAARRIGDLMVRTFGSGERSVLSLGNHQGLSSGVIVHPLAELSRVTGEPQYAALAKQILQQMEERGLAILSGPDKALDISELGTGKAYQLCWILVGLTALYRVTGDKQLLEVTEYWWRNIAENHLTPLGGPWGGIGTHKEVFNARGFFSPYGFTETCSTAAWMSLSRELYAITGSINYLQSFERSLLNALLGAMDENGRDWCYFTFPNGRRNNTYHWACCRSSGAMALEEVRLAASTLTENGISFNLWHSQIRMSSFGGREVRFEHAVQENGFESYVKVDLQGQLDLTVVVRLPIGSRLASVSINGEPFECKAENGFLIFNRHWSDEDVVHIQLDFGVAVHTFTYSVDHHGQEVVRTDYAHLTWGPYVYSTGLIDGYKKEETLRLAKLTPEAPFAIREEATKKLPVIDFVQPGRSPIPFQPYFEAGGRHDGAWRSTWIQVAWQ
ncbi:MAG: glycoside hydrolase family 127 protein [Chlorobia bacterium]|nr:glycoside hydrolase family 127 protein [Fimbriimonadaceae bacterium]